MRLKNILGLNAFWIINKSIAKAVGIESALLLSDLIDKHSFYEEKNQLIEKNGEFYFYSTSEQIKENTTLTYRVQKKCIALLIEKNLIKTILTGIPAKLHFTICENNVLQICNTSFNKSAKLESTKAQTINNTINNTINKESTPEIENTSPHKFYQAELQKAKEHTNKPLADKYQTYVDFMFGKNDLNEPLKNILKLPKQISFAQFDKLLWRAGEVAKQMEKPVKILDIIYKIENTPKYYKNRKSLYLIVLNWLDLSHKY